MEIKGQALGKGLGSLFIVSLFLLLGKVRIGTTDGQWRVGSVGDSGVGVSRRAGQETIAFGSMGRYENSIGVFALSGCSRAHRGLPDSDD